MATNSPSETNSNSNNSSMFSPKSPFSTSDSAKKPTSPGIFNEQNFNAKLENITPTQDSIQTLGLWIICHKSHHQEICKIWLKKFNDRKKYNILILNRRLNIFFNSE